MEIYSCHHKECSFIPTICKTCFMIHMQTTQFYKTEQDKIKMHRQNAFHQSFFDEEHNINCDKRDSKHPLSQYINKL